MLSKKILTAISCLVVTSLVSAQQTVFSYPEKGSKDYSITSMMSFDEKNKTLCLVLKDNEKIEYFLFSPEFKLISKISPTDGLKNSVYAYESQKLFRSVVNDNGFNFIYSVRDKSLLANDPHIRIQTINFDKKEVSVKDYFTISDDERTIEYFTNGNKYYHITVNDKTDEMIVYIVLENGKIEKKSIKFNLKEFYDVKKMKLSDYFSYARSFSPSEETGLRQASDLSKFFVYPDKLVITVQNLKEPTHILSLDLKTFSLTKKKISMNGFCGFENKKQTSYNNSFLFGNRLYVLNVCNEKIEIGMFDPETGTLLAKHEIGESDESFFAESATSSRSIGDREKEKELKTKELIKKMMKGSIGIAPAKNANGNIVITCGTYDEMMAGGGGYYIGGFSTASMPAGGTYSGSNVPVTRSYQNFNPNKNYKQTSAYKATLVTSFKLVLDSAKAGILTNEPVESRYDKVVDYSKNLQPGAQARYLFSFNSKFYFGFYDAGKKQFVIQYLEEDK